MVRRFCLINPLCVYHVLDHLVPMAIEELEPVITVVFQISWRN